MADKTKQGETPEAEAQAAEAAPVVQPVQPAARDEMPEAEEFDQKRAKELIDKLRSEVREKEKDAKAKAKRLEELEAEDQKRRDAELSEIDRLKKQLVEAQTKLTAAERLELCRRAAEEAGLPSWMATRLQGADEGDIMKDAKALAEKLAELQPKQPEPSPAEEAKPKRLAPKLNPTLPVNEKKPETRGEQKSRIFGRKTDIFDPAWVKEHGGGAVIINDKE